MTNSTAAPADRQKFSPVKSQPTKSSIEFVSIKAFEPFTKSQVLLVEIKQQETARPWPETAVLKIYDPKYLDERQDGSKMNEWTAKAEADAKQQREAGAYEPWDEDFLFADEFDDCTEEAAAKREEYYYRLMTECYTSELAAYQALETMQGRHIPRLYTHGIIDTGPTRALNPPFILIEYISDAVKLADVDPISDDIQRMGADLCTAVDQFQSLGVAHADINKHNILTCPDRVVLIDFGCAAVRSVMNPKGETQEEQEKEWERIAYQWRDSRWIRYELGMKSFAGKPYYEIYAVLYS